MADCLRAAITALPDPTPMYCLIGAMAVNAWGRIRATQDIDLLVLSDEHHRTTLTSALEAHGFYVDADWIEHNPMAKDRVVRLAHRSYPGIPLDLLLSADQHDASTLSRRKHLTIFGVSVSVCGPEDLILMKLKASRPHDFEDAVGIVKHPHLQLDLDYLRRWAERLSLQDELRYILDTAGRK